MKSPRAARRLPLLGSVLIALVVLCLLRASSAATRSRHAESDDNAAFLSEALADLRARGLLRHGDRAVFFGEPGEQLPALVERGDEGVPDRSVDFALAGSGSFQLVDRILKTGGVAAVHLGSDPSEMFRLPADYRMAYIRLFGAGLVVAARKVSSDGVESAMASGMWAPRRLLAVPESKKEALNGLEDVVLEPPARGRQARRRTRYLSELMGDSLDGYPRRVFVDVGAPGRTGSAGWFERHYPKRNRDFETIRVDVVPVAGAAAEGGMSEWLSKNVKEEEYVVVKAEAEVVEEMVKGRALGLVDELFLECSNQWQKGKKSRRAYWECLALYGKLRDEGVAVHQWWG